MLKYKYFYVLLTLFCFTACPDLAQGQPTVPEAPAVVPSVNGQVTEVFIVRHAQAQRLAQIFEAIKSSDGKVIYNPESNSFVLIDNAQVVQMMVETGRKLDVMTETRTFVIRQAKIENIVKELEKVISRDAGMITIDTQTNSIQVRDVPERFGEIALAVERLDRREKTVQFQVKILQIILNDEHIDGVDWEAIVSDYQNLAVVPFEGQDKNATLSLGTVNEEDREVLEDALNAVGDIKPVLDFEKNAQIGEKLPLTIRVKDLLFLPLSNLTEENEPEQQMSLAVLPLEIKENNLLLSITPESESVLPPDVGPSSQNMEIDFHDSLVIGGIFKEVWVESMRKIPLLGDIPFLGFAFRAQGRKMRKTEVVIFIKPQLVIEE